MQLKIDFKSIHEIATLIGITIIHSQTYVRPDIRLGNLLYIWKFYVNSGQTAPESAPEEKFESDYDVWPVDITNLGRLFQTMRETPDRIKLEPEGEVPAWLEGSLLRNGPGKYEFGNETFKHFFDPSAIIQGMKLTIRGGSFVWFPVPRTNPNPRGFFRKVL